MRVHPFVGPLCAVLLLAGCARSREVVAPSVEDHATDNWHELATDDDRARIRHWRDSWVEALAQARAADASAVSGEGALLDPDAGERGAPLPAGDYRCRTIKLGVLGAPHPAFRVEPAGQCRVVAEGGRLHFFRLDGAQRPIGILFADGTRRTIFLGTLQLGDEALALRYGRDRERDMAGLVEKIGDGRWRLVLPAPHFESLLDVIELIPAR